VLTLFATVLGHGRGKGAEKSRLCVHGVADSRNHVRALRRRCDV